MPLLNFGIASTFQLVLGRGKIKEWFFKLYPVIVSLQNYPQRSRLWVLTASHTVPALVRVINTTTGGSVWHFSGQVIKDTDFHLFLSLYTSLLLTDHLLGGSQLPCNEQFYWETYMTTSHVSETRVEPSALVKPSEDCSPGWQLNCTLMGDPGPRQRSKAASGSPVLRNYTG